MLNLKKDKEYYIDWDHTNACNKIIKKIYDNIGDINKEIEN